MEEMKRRPVYLLATRSRPPVAASEVWDRSCMYALGLVCERYYQPAGGSSKRGRDRESYVSCMPAVIGGEAVDN